MYRSNSENGDFYIKFKYKPSIDILMKEPSAMFTLLDKHVTVT